MSKNIGDESLVKTEGIFEKVFKLSSTPMGITDIKDGHFIEVSDAFLDLTGLNRDEIIGSTSVGIGIITPEKRSFVLNEVQTKGKVENLEIQVPKGGGECRDGLLNIFKISVGYEDYLITIFTDITDRKRAEDALHRSVEQFSKAFHLSPYPMTIISMKDMKYLDVNESSLKYSGYSLEEHLGHTPLDQDIFDNEFISKGIKLLREKGEFREMEFSFQSKTGELHVGLLSATTIDINNEPCILTVTQIITERKLMEEDLKKYRDHLEELVKERTADLTKANIELKHEIEIRKTTEESLRSRELELDKGRKDLEEMNSALRVLIKQRENDKINLEDNIISNIKVSVMPYVERLDTISLKEDEKHCLSMIKSNLKEIASPFIKKLSSQFLSLTPSEIKIASMIREGKRSKDIAEIMNISLNTVHSYRYNIRIKTGLKNDKVNLRSYLQALD